jgi:hypothetical protein
MARRTDSDQTLLALLNEGMTLQQAAEEMGVTKQALSLRLKGMGHNAQDYRRRREAKRRAAAFALDAAAIERGEGMLTLQQAATRYGWTRRNLNRAVTLKVLPGHRVQGKWYVTPTAVEHWIAHASSRPGPPPGTGPQHQREAKARRDAAA